jgi:hypothetical protein
MTPEHIFSICSTTAMAGWILLIVTPRRSWAPRLVAGRVTPLLLAGVYFIVLAAHWHEMTGGIQFAGGSGRTILESLVVAGGLDSLSGLRPVHRIVGGTGCRGKKNLVLAGDPVHRSDVHVGAEWAP